MRFNILFIFILLILISGCITSETYGSSRGVDIQFVNNYPPDLIREGSRVSFVLNLVNHNSFDVDGRVCVSDSIDYDYYGGIPRESCSNFNLITSDIKNKYFDEKKINFDSYIYNNLIRDEDVNIIAEATYKMDMDIILDKFCITPLYLENKECSLHEIISGGSLKNNNAPVYIEKIEKTITPGGDEGSVYVSLDITLRKMKGEIVSDLISDSVYTDPRIYLEVDSDFGVFECEELVLNELRGNDETKQLLTCNSLLGIGSESVRGQLNINMKYYFKNVVSKQIKIQAKEQEPYQEVI